MREGWSYKKLGEVCEVFDSMRKPVTKKDRKEGNYPYYGATGIQDYVDSYLFDGRYLLVGEDGAKWGANEGTAFIIEGKSWVNNHAHIIQLNKDVNDILVKYYLNFKDLSDYITGAVVPKLTQQALKNIQIPIPPLTIQQQIVSELDLLSHILDQKRQQLKEYDSLAESIFYDMYGDPVENPKGWEVKKLSDVFTIKTGKLDSNAMVNNGKYPFFTCSKEVFSINEYAFDCEALLLAGNNASGNYDVKYYKGKFNAYQRTYVLTTKDNNEYSVLKIQLEKRLVELKQKSLGISTKYLTLKILDTISLILPPLTLQRSFAAKIESIEHQKQLLRASIKETEMLFQSRMDYWFNG